MFFAAGRGFGEKQVSGERAAQNLWLWRRMSGSHMQLMGLGSRRYFIQKLHLVTWFYCSQFVIQLASGLVIYTTLGNYLRWTVGSPNNFRQIISYIFHEF